VTLLKHFDLLSSKSAIEMTLSFTLNGVKQNINPQGGNYSLNYPCSSKTTCYHYESEFPPGKYSFNVYGAGGGSYINGYESPGGFSTGVLVLKQKTRLYFYVGAKGVCSSSDKAQTDSVFGGGGSGFNGIGSCRSCSGGGASDIRVIQNTLNHRVIVAGGAGGSGYYNKYMFGGKGGGTSGTKGEICSSGNIGGGPGNQTSGGESVSQAGIFGYGANRTDANGGGGGGGWFGGGAAGPGACGCTAGGGGSGFIFTQLNSLVYLNSSFLLLSGRTETNTGNNVGDGRINIEVLEMIVQKTKIHRTCNYRNVFVLPLLLFWPYIMS
jgi:hypothetical protein